MADIESILRQMSNENTAKTFAFNSQEAQKERSWSQNMSDTSHQREVNDLKRAGLNPVLSTNGGASAYSASSASGTADNSAAGLIAQIYQTKLNNENAMKIAKENNRIQKEINDSQIASAQYMNKQSIAQAKRDNANAYKIAKTNAQASKYASDNAYSASRYASDNAYNASVYGSDSGYKSTKYSTNRSKYGILYNAANSASKGATKKSLNSNAKSTGKVISKVGKAIWKFITKK